MDSFKKARWIGNGLRATVGKTGMVSPAMEFRKEFNIEKMPKTAVIRTKRDGDKFTKFGGGTKKLNDYLTDKKVPLRIRDNLVVIADGNDILAIFDLAISDKIKVDENTENIISLTINKN